MTVDTPTMSTEGERHLLEEGDKIVTLHVQHDNPGHFAVITTESYGTPGHVEERDLDALQLTARVMLLTGLSNEHAASLVEGLAESPKDVIGILPAIKAITVWSGIADHDCAEHGCAA